MNNRITHITFLGSGSIATALGHIMARKDDLNVRLFSIEEEVIESINSNRYNSTYFPSVKLSKTLKATNDKDILSKSDYLFLALPSSVTVDYTISLKKYFPQNTVLVNLAKGFGNEHKTICQCLEESLDNPICTMKGPSFARELINKTPTSFTIGLPDNALINPFKKMFKGTSIYTDYTTDVIGVEISSILKNIYAIAIGIVDAHFNSPNLRFLVLTKAFKEMKHILTQFGGEENTMFLYCGYGDFGLTALNDLSRNRTLGLLIGKGFFSDDISEHILLEGKIAVNVFCEEISKRNSLVDFPIINELYKVFNKDYDIFKFVDKLLMH